MLNMKFIDLKKLDMVDYYGHTFVSTDIGFIFNI